MTTAPPAATLYKHLAEVMAAVDRVPKNGVNAFHGYKFATEADISAAIRMELSKRNIAVLVSSRISEVRPGKTPKGKDTYLTDVACSVTFACGTTGESVTVEAAGTGDDPSDKGTYKAITGAVKYALMKTFLVPTGDEPESSTSSAATIAPGEEYVFTFGKYEGTRISEVPADYLDFLLRQPKKKGFEKQREQMETVIRSELHRREKKAGAAA